MSHWRSIGVKGRIKFQLAPIGLKRGESDPPHGVSWKNRSRRRSKVASNFNLLQLGSNLGKVILHTGRIGKTYQEGGHSRSNSRLGPIAPIELKHGENNLQNPLMSVQEMSGNQEYQKKLKVYGASLFRPKKKKFHVSKLMADLILEINAFFPLFCVSMSRVWCHRGLPPQKLTGFDPLHLTTGQFS